MHEAGELGKATFWASEMIQIALGALSDRPSLLSCLIL